MMVGVPGQLSAFNAEGTVTDTASVTFNHGPMLLDGRIYVVNCTTTLLNVTSYNPMNLKDAFAIPERAVPHELAGVNAHLEEEWLTSTRADHRRLHAIHGQHV